MKTTTLAITIILCLLVGIWLGHALGVSAQARRDQAVYAMQLKSIHSMISEDDLNTSGILKLILEQLKQSNQLSQEYYFPTVFSPHGLVDSIHPKVVAEFHPQTTSYIASLGYSDTIQTEQGAAANP